MTFENSSFIYIYTPAIGSFRQHTQFVNPLTHSHTMTPFDAPGKEAFWKLWEKGKLLVTSNFSFSHSVFYLLG